MSYKDQDRKILFRRTTLICIAIIGGSIIMGTILIPYVIGHYGSSQIPLCPPNENYTDVNPPVCIPPVKIVHDARPINLANTVPETVRAIPMQNQQTQNTYLSTYDALQLETYMDTERMLNDNNTELWVSGPYTVCPVDKKEHCQEWYDQNKVIPDDPVFQNLIMQQKLDKILKEQNKTNALLETLKFCESHSNCKFTVNETDVNQTAMTLFGDDRVLYVPTQGEHWK